jgi:hypothetical protein
MACSAGDDKKVPDQVAIGYPRIGCEKGDTGGVGQASRNQ